MRLSVQYTVNNSKKSSLWGGPVTKKHWFSRSQDRGDRVRGGGTWLQSRIARILSHQISGQEHFYLMSYETENTCSDSGQNKSMEVTSWMLFFPTSTVRNARVFLLSGRCSWFGRWHRRMLINSTPWRFWRRRRSKVHQPEATDYLHRNKTGWQDWRCNAGVNINVNCIFFSRKAILCLLSA